MPTPTYPGATSWSLISSDLSTVNGTMSDFHFRFTGYKEGTWNLRIFDEYGQSSSMVLDLDFDSDLIESGFHFNDLYEVNINESINLVAGHKYTYVFTPIDILPDFYYLDYKNIDYYLGYTSITSLDSTGLFIPSSVSLNNYNYNSIFSIDMTGLIALDTKFSDANLIVGNDLYTNFTDGNDYFDASLYYYLRNTLSNESAGDGDDFVNVGSSFGGNFSGGPGNDIIRYDGTHAGVSIYGDGGDDVIYSGGGYADGGPGNDIIIADSDSWISGGGGQDILYSGTWSYNKIELWGGEVVWNVDYTDILQIHGSGAALSDRNPDGSYTVNWSGGSVTLHTLHPIALELHPDQSNPDWSEFGIVNSATKQFTLSSDVIDFNFISYDDMFLNSASRYRFNSLDGDDRITLPDDDAGLESWGMLHVLFSAGKGNDTVIGGNGSDTISGDDGDDLIHGNGGDDVIIAGSGNDFVSGDEGNDRFILTTEDLPNAGDPSPLDIFDGGNGDDLLKLSGLTGTQGTIAYLIDSAGAALTGPELATTLGLSGNTLDMSTFVGNFVSVETIVGSAGRDTLIFSGGTQDNFASAVNFGFNSSLEVSFAETTITFLHATKGTVQEISLKGIEQVIFADGITNSVNLDESKGSVALEMLRLADEVNGPQLTMEHTAELLAFEPSHPSSQVEDVTNRAEARGWHALSALELGIAPGANPASGLQYSLVEGFYQAVDTNTISLGGLLDRPEANAMIVSGLIDDVRTSAVGDEVKSLAVSFRGTDQWADYRNYADFHSHYDKYAPLIEGMKAYLIANPDVKQLLVSGHSLGAGMAELFALDLETDPSLADWRNGGGHIEVYTMGSPGGEGVTGTVQVNGDFVTHIFNFVNTDDLVPGLGELSSNPLLRGALAEALVRAGTVGAAANALLDQIEPKPREGSNVYIDSDIANFPFEIWPFAIPEHGGHLYIDNLVKLLDFASDASSPFHGTLLASSLRGNTLYSGPDIHIAVGQPLFYDPRQPRTDYDARYTTEFSLVVRAYENDSFVLGNYASDDLILVDYRAPQVAQIFDGATNGPQNEGDILSFMASGISKDDFFYHFDAVSGGLDLTLKTGGLFATLYRIEIIAFRSDGLYTVQGSDLVSLAAQTPQPSLPQVRAHSTLAAPPVPTFSITGAYAWADAGDGDMHVVGTAGNDIIYLGHGNKDVAAGGGNDLIVVRAAGPGDTIVIDGGAGIDVIYGGAGNETYLVDTALDKVVILTPDGHHTVIAATDYILPDNIQDLVLGVGATSGRGNELDNLLTGNAADNEMDGADGDDTLAGAGGADLLFGNLGNDTLDGGSGADVLVGGLGDDRYLIDTQADMIFEAADEGTDSAVTTASFYLYANVENLTLASGAGDLFGVGNELANTITGNEGSNLLIAGASDDLVHGGAGVDSLFGEDGADTLNGDAGIDYLVGGIGNDTLQGGDDADALYGEDGDDTLNGGSSFHTDILVGGAGNDVLDGRSGQANPDYDLLDGGDGNDSYYVDTGADLTFEAVGGGTDTVYANIPVPNAGLYLYANVENLILEGTTAFGVGNELANVLTGSASGNWLLGGLGSDMINGKEGNDVLFGEGGADTFVFDSGTGKDVIGDFQAGTDKINLIGYALTFAQLQTLFVQVGNVGAIQMLNGDVIVLHNVTMASLSASDFVFG